jgi:hypothetical protein
VKHRKHGRKLERRAGLHLEVCAEGDTLRSKDRVGQQNAGGEARLLPSAQVGDTLFL